MLDAPALPPSESRALFLDVDGTLVDIAPTPELVVVLPQLKSLLLSLSERHEGALALISGRPIRQLDELFAPLRLPAAGLHGLERRDASGNLITYPQDSALLKATRNLLTDFVQRHEGTWLEDKGQTLALHYRLAPQFEPAARAAAAAALAGLGSEWELLEGKKVLELKPSAYSKAGAIEQFMRLPPFAGRVPVFAGDDVTDETGFAYVNKRGGQSIQVGTNSQTCAQHRLPDVTSLHQWLRRMEQS